MVTSGLRDAAWTAHVPRVRSSRSSERGILPSQSQMELLKVSGSFFFSVVVPSSKLRATKYRGYSRSVNTALRVSMR